MVERNSGIIINVASGASFHKMSMWSTYSAAKVCQIAYTCAVMATKNCLENDCGAAGVQIFWFSFYLTVSLYFENGF